MLSNCSARAEPPNLPGFASDVRDGQIGALLANLRPEISQLQFNAPLSAASVEVKLLDRNACGPAGQALRRRRFRLFQTGLPLLLPPYEVAFLRFS